MSNAPYPGGCEEKYLEDEKRAMQESENDDEVEPTPSRTHFNAFISFFRSREQRWSPRGRPWPRGHILKSLASKVKSLALAFFFFFEIA